VSEPATAATASNAVIVFFIFVSRMARLAAAPG
jgi:hypothetical protein